MLSGSVAGCARTVCEESPRPNVDSIWHARGGPPRLIPDASIPKGSVELIVLDSVHRRPIVGAGARFLPDAIVHHGTDSTGSLQLALPPAVRSVLEVGALGFVRRRDTVEVEALRGRRMEVALPYPTGGDIDVVVCHRTTKFWSW